MNKHQKLVQQQFLNDEETVIKRLKQIYGQSLKDINKKVFELDSSISMLQKALDSIEGDEIGELAAAVLKNKSYYTPAEAQQTIKSMLQSKVYQKKYQKALQGQVDGVLDKMQAKQYTSVSEYLTECYENGFLGTMFDLQGQGIPLCFPMDQEQMVRAVQLDSKISKGLYSKLGEDVAVLKKKIAAQVSRGISTGMSYQQVAQQLAGTTNIGFNNAVRIARTEGHRIQCQAGMDACEKAKEKGADVVKQWDSTMDSATRESHVAVDGEIRELDKPFSNGLMFPGDPAGGAAEVINCRCALLQRARWALDEDELKALQEKAAYFGIDKTDNFNDFKEKYLKAAGTEPEVTPKKEYLTEKKLKQNIDDAEAQLSDLHDQFKKASGGVEYDDIVDAFGSLDDFASGEQLKALKTLKKQMDDLDIAKTEWQEKLDKKLVAKETKKLKKEQMLLQDELDNFDVKTYSNIWKDDVTTADWYDKQGSIQAKKQYFEGKLKSDPSNAAKWQGLLDDLDDFDKKGAEYYKIQSSLTKTTADLTKLQKNGIITPKNADAFTQERKDAAYWFTDKNGSVKAADGVLRDKSGEVWRGASTIEKDSIYEYTKSYSKFNEPLRGIEYGTNKYLGVGNVDLNMIGTKYGGYKPGQVKKQIDAVTSIIDKSEYDFDIWLQRGCRRDGMDKFFGIDMRDFDLPEAQLAAKLIGTTPTEYAFMSTGVAKGKGLNLNGGVLLNVYAPKGTKMMYVEPFSAFGNGSGRAWDGITKQSHFGHEAEMLMQRGTKFRVTKVEKNNGIIYVDMEVIEQGVK